MQTGPWIGPRQYYNLMHRQDIYKVHTLSTMAPDDPEHGGTFLQGWDTIEHLRVSCHITIRPLEDRTLLWSPQIAARSREMSSALSLSPTLPSLSSSLLPSPVKDPLQ
eukprot:TRINITY_DN8315_c0_g2_i1.p2 TRINITY_DN8315_c0_g2~~TRINITY_DN8315_c0_g2_i1.p2  ORF type:complete len:108 (-),score=8.28 TRINITY_DN8315_c0_g2_i1:1134-1457(-)